MTGATPAAGGPLSRVVGAIQRGACTRAALTAMTGLGSDMVDASLDRLGRLGVLEEDPFASACTDASGAVACGSCPVASGCGAVNGGRAPVMLRLVRR